MSNITVNVRRLDRYVDISVTVGNTHIDCGLFTAEQAEPVLDALNSSAEALNDFIEEHLS